MVWKVFVFGQHEYLCELHYTKRCYVRQANMHEKLYNTKNLNYGLVNKFTGTNAYDYSLKIPFFHKKKIVYDFLKIPYNIIKTSFNT